ncbi:MAG: twin-arginine translocase subunit TatB [Gammaproteobacteria bacterium]|nr:MAG: twin-arginine translocase subunit TatB [Gammaproteobacteria bacterium]
MFDIGFSELIVCAVVALVVIGPERMPEAVRTIGLWIGRVKRSLSETRSEIERQIGVDDIRRQLHNEDIMRTLESARRDMDKVISQTQESLNTIEHNYSSEPDLPYHAHMNEIAEKTLELPVKTVADSSNELIAPTAEKTPEHLSAATVATLAKNNTDNKTS